MYSINDYIKTKNLCKRNINYEKNCLDEFSIYLSNQKLISPNMITPESISVFIKFKSLSCSKSTDKLGTAISKYLKYLYSNKIINIDYSFIVEVKTIEIIKLGNLLKWILLLKFFNQLTVVVLLGKEIMRLFYYHVLLV